MANFDITQFEQRIDELLAAYKRLEADHRALAREYDGITQHNAQIRRRLQAVIERIAALEKEAEAQTPA